MSNEDPLLTTLCAICHTQPPKYRCPRCETRTCCLPCTRRHKLWSQCSGVRDPAAYLRTGELATESAFDRDFNFITGIERRLERAGREAENRGIRVDGKGGVRDPGVVGLDSDENDNEDVNEGGRKRKRGPGSGPVPERGIVKGEAGFLRRAQDAGVKVIKAPRGMSRAKMNGSKWHSKQKCLQWAVEWVTDDGTKRVNCAETLTIAEAYDRAFPLTKEEKQLCSQNSLREDEKPATTQPEPVQGTIPQPTSNPPDNEPTDEQETAPESKNQIVPHRNVFFYLHRPRTATKQAVLSPVSPDQPLTSALRDRIVLEFPTIYILKARLEDKPSEESKYILEEEYLRTHQNTEPEVGDSEDTDAQQVFGAVDIPDVDEGKMMEVLKKDLLSSGPTPVAGS
ncbi:hypothetical protein BDW62DRAFT_213157 [Aspergillus aurantiobrunneus]